MASIASCNAEIRRYKNLKSKINSIISYLSRFDDTSSDLIQDLNRAYQINSDSSVLENRIANNKKDVKETSNYLKYTIIPAINSEINELNRTIQRLEEEARRQEEARKKAAAKASQNTSATVNYKA